MSHLLARTVARTTFAGFALCCAATVLACGDDTQGPTGPTSGPDASAFETGATEAGSFPDATAKSDATSLPDAASPGDGGLDATYADASGITPDAAPVNADGASPDGASPDAADAGPCDFAVFVTGLIVNDTTQSALPSTDLGQSCVDKQDPTQFQPLFP